VAVNFIGEGNRVPEKSQTCCKSQTNFIT